MAENLIFIGENNPNTYEFVFSQDPDTAWGDGWNVAPARNHPKLYPDKNTISNIYRVDKHAEMMLACYNSCFSMQDCIDGIIPLGFTDIDNPKQIKYDFGEEIDEVFQKWHDFGYVPTKLKIDNGEDIIEGLINDLGGDNNE